MLALAMKYLGRDPFQMHHSLDTSYRPVGDPEADPVYPASTRRVKAFTLAAAAWLEEIEAKRQAGKAV